MSDKASGLADLISVPNGGGALKGLGEKFGADQHTGAGNFSVPIAVPGGRNGLQPQLSLAFSTGAGNGAFGLGWSLGIPGIARLTAKGIPRYRDGAGREDTFVLTGAEDLVPMDNIGGVTRFRPRSEGLFARIERHQDNTSGSDHWRVQTKDGLTSIYGSTQPPPLLGTIDGRPVLADPRDRRRVFAWRLSETCDLFGNRIVYDYFRDGGSDLGHGDEQIYLRRIRYVDLPEQGPDACFVSVEFLYDNEASPPGITPEFPTRRRTDAFSDYRAGFEIRTRRRCKWIVVRTHPAVGDEILVRAYELVYLDEHLPANDPSLPLNGVSLLSRINVVGYDDQGIGSREQPPLDFEYSRFTPQGRRFTTLHGRGLPVTSLANPDMELVDLFGHGLPDIVELGGDVVRYWRNLGDGRFDMPRPFDAAPASWRLSDSGVQLVDANGDGRADLLVSTAGLAGYYPLDFNGGFSPRSFRRYDQAPSFNLEDPEVRLIDLTGDGVSDVLRSGTSLECYFNDPARGWLPENTARLARQGLDVSFADPRSKLADFSGDGLQDIAVIHQRRVDYWPNLGYGRFGERLTMAIPAGLPEQFDPRRVLLGDVDGDGLADLLYVSDREVTLWINRSGSGWSAPLTLSGTPAVDDLVTVRLADLNGGGVAGVLWTRDADGFAAPQHYFLDLTGGSKPYLLVGMDNNLGAITKVTYSTSTREYLRDAADPRTHWRTTLPFPVQVVERVAVTDVFSGGTLHTEYRYHHGYWDGMEREFRGFGMVEQLDTEVFSAYSGRGLAGDADALRQFLAQQSFAPPVLTRTWFHQGPVDPVDGGPWREFDGSPEYWPRNDEKLRYLPDGATAVTTHQAGIDAFLATLPLAARRDALRVLRGSVLRSETYALDGSPLQEQPYTVVEHAYDLCEVEPAIPGSGQQPVFLARAVAQRTSQWERGDEPLTQFSFSGDFDEVGQARRQLAIACPRGWTGWNDVPAAGYLATLTLTAYATPAAGCPALRDRVCRVRTYEITGNANQLLASLLTVREGDARCQNLVAETLTYYDGPAYQGLPFGQLGAYGVAVCSESLVLTEAILQTCYGGERPPYLDPTTPFAAGANYPAEFVARLPVLAGYHHYAGSATAPQAGGWYVQTCSRFDFQSVPVPAQACGLLLAQRDALGNEASIAPADYQFRLLPRKITGPTGLSTQADYNLRVLQPALVIDANGNRTEVRYTPVGLMQATYFRGKTGHSEGDIALPSVTMHYGLRAFCDGRQSDPAHPQPAYIRAVRRVCHDSDPDDSGETIESREYSDGFGRLLQTRTQGEAVRFGEARFGGELLPAGQEAALSSLIQGVLNNDPATPNVVVSGWQIYDNKGRVVEKYEPYFDDGWAYRLPAQDAKGQKALIYYDALGRAVRTVNPDHSEQRVIRGIPHDLADPPQSPLDSNKYRPSPWESYSYDANDNAGRTHGGMAPHNSYTDHYNTPASAEVDALGRTVRAIVRHRALPTAPGSLGAIEEHLTRSSFDIQGNLLSIRDALGREVFTYGYDLAKHSLHSESLDAGRTWVVLDAAGNPLESGDTKGAHGLYAYDVGKRPTHQWARDSTQDSLTLRQRLHYGEEAAFAANAASNNQLGKLVRQYDEAGLVSVDAYDFKGAILQSSRQALSDEFLLANVRQAQASGNWAIVAPRIDWAAPPTNVFAASRTYVTRNAFDALGRPKWSEYPEAANEQDVTERYRLRPTYNRAGALERVDLVGPLDSHDQGDVRPFVQRIAYNAKGQRSLVAYGNGVLTRYAFDAASFRLARLRSERFSQNAGAHLAYQCQGAALQDIAYGYDLAGNILSMQDATPGCGVANNAESLLYGSPLREQLSAGDALIRRFEYDPLYRLTAASGREAGNIGRPRPWDDVACGGFNSGQHGTANQDNAPSLASLYREDYSYDAAGNMLALHHSACVASGGCASWQVQWTRGFGMDGRSPDQWRQAVASHLTGDWVAAPSNRLTHVAEGDPANVTQSHFYDAVGNLLIERNARHFAWDHANRIKAFSNQAGSGQPSVYALYLYDAAGQRVKKLVLKGNRYSTTTYLATNFEEYAEQNLDGSGKVGNCTLHVMDDKRRLAMVRIGKAMADDGMRDHPIQYHLSDHLGSSILVLSGAGDWINREEYFPYGETSFGSFGRKRYRFTGRERDEESGLNYHGARYQAPWLARWLSPDPAGPGDDLNLFAYAHDSPLRFNDVSGMAGADQSGVPADGGADNLSAPTGSGSGKTGSGAFTSTSPDGEVLPGGVQEKEWNDVPVPKAETKLLWDRKQGVCHDQDGTYVDNSKFALQRQAQREQWAIDNERARKNGPQLSSGKITTFMDDQFMGQMARTGQLDAIRDYGLFPVFLGLGFGRAGAAASEAGQARPWISFPSGGEFSRMPVQVGLDNPLAIGTAQIRRDLRLIGGDMAIGVYEHNGERGFLVGLSTTNGVHAERQLAGLATDMGIPGEAFTEIYSELNFCTITFGGGCRNFIQGAFPNARYLYTFEYGATAASRQAGVAALVGHNEALMAPPVRINLLR